MKRLLFTTCLLLSYIAASATIRYVRVGGSGNGLSWVNASGNIQAMINSSVSGDEIWVASGTYLPANRAGDGSTERERAFVLKSNIKIYGGFPATGEPVFADRNWLINRTVLSGDIGTPGDRLDNCLHVVIASSTTNTLVNGFVISDGTANLTTGGRTTVNTDWVEQDRGGAWFNVSSSPTLEDISFENNGAINGGAWYNKSGDATLNRVFFRSNVAVADGGAIYFINGSTKFTNTLFSGNRAARGGAWFNDYGNGLFDNCTFAGNFATSEGGAWYHRNGLPKVRNSIVWGNSAPINAQVYTVPLVSNIIIEGSAISGVINADPKFTAPVAASNAPTLAGDYTLMAVSPAVNGGDVSTNTLNYAIQVGSLDLAGNTRIQKNTVDMGAYETSLLPILIPTNGNVFVKQNGAGNLTGINWANAAPELADALIAAKTNTNITSIYLGAGTYKPLYHPLTGVYSANDRDNAFVMVRNVRIHGGFVGNDANYYQRNLPANRSILSGDIGLAADHADNAYHVLIAAGTMGSAELDGVIIQDGNADGSGTLSLNSEIISRATGGGLMQINNTLPIRNTVFSNNRAVQGAAYSGKTGNTSIANSLFKRNTSTSSGAAIYSDGGTVNVYNSTFHVNNSGTGNTIHTSSAPRVVGSIFYNNTGSAADIFTTTGAPSISYSLTPLSTPGTGNITSTASPFISDDELNANYARLKSGSPALNSGDPQTNVYEYPVQLDYLDLASASRIQRSRVDMGPYESNFATQPAATTEAASSVFYTSTTLKGKVDDLGANTTVSFEYSTSPLLSAPLTVSASPSSISPESGETEVSSSLSGLPSGTQYYFRIKAENSAGTTYGLTLSFTTLSLVTPPLIVSFTPESGAAGTSVVITGANFSSTANRNHVYFGAVKATVTAASATSLTVTAPTGSTHQFIRVVNLDTKATGYANSPFILTFPTKDLMKANDFAAKLDLTVGNGPTRVVLADLNDDAKPEVIVANESNGSISFFRNRGTAGSIVAATFANRINYGGGSSFPRSIVVSDLDADGKPDVLVNYYDSPGGFYVLRNTSPNANSLSFEDEAYFSSEEDWANAVAVGDIDGDGKPDVAVANFINGNVAVMQNISSGPGVIAFAAPVMFTTGSNTGYVTIADLNNDGKPELIAARETSSTVYIFRNISTAGIINTSSFAARTTITAVGAVGGIAVGDLDKDGNNDLAFACFNNARVSVFRNTSTTPGGSITFGPKADLVTANQPYSVAIADINGDGRPDILSSNSSANSFSILQSKAQAGTLTVASFEAKIDVGTGSGSAPAGIAVGDVDGDGKPDVLTANENNNRVSVFRSLVEPTLVVNSIEIIDPSPSASTSVKYKITFSRAPQTVTSAGLALTTTGLSGATIGTISGSGTEYTVTVNTGTGEGTIRLDVRGTGTGILDPLANPPRPYTSGALYTIDRTNPTLSAISIGSNNSTASLAKAGDEVTLNFTASETGPAPAVMIAGETATVTNTGGDNWKAVHTLTGTESEGNITFTIDFSDQAGNNAARASLTSDASAVVFDNTPPDTPPGLTASPGDTETILDWTALSTSDLGAYQLYGGTSTAPTTLLASLPAGTLTYTHTGLINGTPYYYRISASDLAGNEGIASADVTVIPVAPQAISFAATGSAPYGTLDFDPGASSLSSAVNPITYASSDPNVIAIMSGKIHIVGIGTSTITASQAASTSYRAASDASQVFTVTVMPIIIQAEARTKVYGEPDPALTYSVLPALMASDSFSGTLSRTAGENTGTYIISQNSLSAGSNYLITYEPAELTINAKPLLVSANELSKVYGEADPALTYTVTPDLIGSDSFSGALSRTAGENIGTYIISQNSLSAGSNYLITYEPADLTITAKPLLVSANELSKVYGETDPALTYTVTPDLLGGDRFSGALSRESGENAGSYEIKQNTLDAGVNYMLSYQSAQFAIAKKELTIRADDKSKLQSTLNPEFTFTYNGFVNGENRSVLSSPPTATTPAGDASLAGDYPIVPGGATADNYDITYVNGVLRVTHDALAGFTFTPSAVYENNLIGALAGTFAAASSGPEAQFTYALVAGTGDADNASFTISGDQLLVPMITDYETKSPYSIRVRCLTSFGASTEAILAVNILDVNESPTLAAIANQVRCYSPAPQQLALSGITAGPELNQALSISVSTDKPALFTSINAVIGGNTGELRYVAAAGQGGTAIVTITIKDNGGTAEGGIDTFSRTFSITINPLPEVHLNSNTGVFVISKGETMSLHASGGLSYSWQGSSGIISGENTSVLTVRPAQSSSYTVTVTTAAGCTAQQTVLVDVREDYLALNRANILTPNGDGVNDKWIVENIDMYPKNEVRVVDRAGRAVYQKKGYDNSWEGTVEGAPLAEGTYYYVIDFGNGASKIKGFITLLRNQ